MVDVLACWAVLVVAHDRDLAAEELRQGVPSHLGGRVDVHAPVDAQDMIDQRRDEAEVVADEEDRDPLAEPLEGVEQLCLDRLVDGTAGR